MSSPPSSSDTTSPSLVRSSGDLVRSNHVSPTSKAGASAITIPTFAHDRAEPISRSWTETLYADVRTSSSASGADAGTGQNGFCHHAGSNEGTPRLQPVPNGSSNLPFIARGNKDCLEFSRLSPQQTWPTLSSSISTLTSSLLNSSKSSPANSLSSTFSTSYSTQYTRARSYGSLKPGNMAEDARPETGPEHGTTVMEANSSARGPESSSEDRRHRSRSRSGRRHLEKRIEASLAEAEPAANARSRKSSHMMQLFKENNTAVTEGRSSQEKPRKTSRSASSGYIAKETGLGSTEGLTERSQDPMAGEVIIDEDTISDTRQTSLDGKENEGATDRNTARSRMREESRRNSAATLTSPRSAAYYCNDEILDSEISVPSLPSLPNEPSKTRLPSRLLEEIRNHHNLGTPVNAKFKTSQLNDGQRTIEIQDIDVTPAGRRAIRNDRCVATDTEADEISEHLEGDLDEDSSDKELISSALYYPHESASPDALEGVSLEKVRGARDSNEAPSKAWPLSPTTDENGDSEDVDIALESQKLNRYLHGALPKKQAPYDEATSDRAVDTGTSSASESEYSSFTDGERTPKATPSAAKSAFLHSKHRKGRRPRAAPLEAVELKPFKHQVGGHSTVFRFSKKAVCKQLSNKENEFYEIVEHSHPELLRFMPRYVKSCNCSTSSHSH